jgi:membrane associated rhomboid family serine protease/tetratricopeptide (TPR) repeat protein
MENDGAQDPGLTPSSPGTNPRDGLIDFSQYSLAQLQELQHSVDRHTFPQNFSHLMAEIERRAGQVEDPCTQASVIAGRFTSLDGLRGWLQAKRGRCPVYGAGSIEARSLELVLRGWQRTWLGVPLQSEVSIPTNAIRNCVQEGDRVRFEFKRRYGFVRRIEFQAETAPQAAMLADSLPKVYVAGFERRWYELQEFNRRLAAVGQRPWVTPAVVLANTTIFIAMAVAAKRLGNFDSQQLLNWGANYGPVTANGQWWRLVSALFVHLSASHLLLNMWAFWNVGRMAERLYGRWAFLALYFVGGIFASLASIAWDPSHSSVGASGAIFAIFGAFLAFLAQRRMLVPAAIVRAHWPSTLAFVLFNLVNGALRAGIDNAAHVGGLISGFALGWILARPLESAAREHFPVRQSLAAIGLTAALALAGIWQVKGIGSQLTVPEQYFRTHAWYLSGEGANLRVWQNLAARAGAGTISDSDLGQHFKTDILPFWQEANERLQKQDQSIQADQQPFARLVADFVRSRLDWARAVIDAAENNNAGSLTKGVDLAKQTTLTQARIERVGMRANMDHRQRALAHSPVVVRIRSLFSFGPWKCVQPPPAISVPLGASDARTDGPAMRNAAGCLAQRLFMNGDYKTLDSMMNRYSAAAADLPDGGSTFAGIVHGLSDLFDYGMPDPLQAFERTSDWRRSIKDSVEAELVEAMLFRTWAWSVRGGGYAKSVSPQAWAIFAYRTEMAAASLEEISEAESSNPLWYQLSLSIGLDQSLAIDKLRAIFDQGVAKFPRYLPLYAAMLRILMPRWNGSYEKVDQLITDAAAKLNLGPGQLTYARLYWIYSSLEDDDINVFNDALAKWPMMKQGFKEMMSRYPASDLILNAFEKFACIDGDTDEYRAARSVVEKRLAATAWSAKFSLQACDRKFAEQAALDYIDRGNALLDRFEFNNAIANFDKAIASDPKAAMAYADRGMAYVWKHNGVQARKDFDAAFALDPHNPVVFRGRGMLASAAGNPDDAIAAFSKDLDIEPANIFSLEFRARAYEQTGDTDNALADSAKVVRLQPRFINMYWFRASIYRHQGDIDKAMAEAAALTSANPNDAHAYIAAGAIYSSLKRYRQAMLALTRAVEMAPTQDSYLARAEYRPTNDLAGKRADIDAALKLNPTSTRAMKMRAQMQSDAGQFAAAIATLNAAMEIQVGSYSLRVARGIDYAKTGQADLADADFAVARGFATDPNALNDMCWTMAKSAVALPTALSACDAAIAGGPLMQPSSTAAASSCCGLAATMTPSAPTIQL